MSYNLLFVDTETSGLDPLKGAEVIEICAKAYSVDGRYLDSFETHILPINPVDPKAAEVNGYTSEAWDRFGAIEQLRAIQIFNARFHGEYMIVGWNPGFDLSFIKDWPKKSLNEGLKLAYHPIDIYSMCLPWLIGKEPFDKKRKYVSLSDAVHYLLGKELYHPDFQAHSARIDVSACIELFFYVKYNARALPPRYTERDGYFPDCGKTI